MKTYFKTPSRHKHIVKTLNTVGNTTVAKIIPSKKDKARQNQRRDQSWRNDE